MDSPLPVPERAETLIEGQDVQETVETPPESLFVTGAAVAAGVMTRRGLQSLWKQWRGVDPPNDPAAPGVGWSDALIWAAAGVARVLSRRSAAAAVRRFSS